MKIAIIDGSLSMREALKSLLSFIECKPKIKTYKDGYDFLMEYKSYLPDIVFVDPDVDIIDGEIISSILQKKLPDCKIVSFTISQNEFTIRRVIKAGVHAVLCKKTTLDEIKLVLNYFNDNNLYLSKCFIEAFPNLNYFIEQLKTDKILI